MSKNSYAILRYKQVKHTLCIQVTGFATNWKLTKKLQQWQGIETIVRGEEKRVPASEQILDCDSFPDEPAKR